MAGVDETLKPARHRKLNLGVLLQPHTPWRHNPRAAVLPARSLHLFATPASKFLDHEENLIIISPRLEDRLVHKTGIEICPKCSRNDNAIVLHINNAPNWVG
jgi:hypothetical protein